MENKDFFLLVDKPAGLTSHQVVERLRKITGIKKIGHSGTLDPLATGLLILGLGRSATKKLDQLQKLDKEYLVKIRLGVISDTFDREGEVQERKVDMIPSQKLIEGVLREFEGEIEQIPPPFSAKKIKGRRLYQLARKGIRISGLSSKIMIYKIELINYSWPFLELKIHCSSGTYIRSLASEIGKKLKCGGLVEELRRLKIGDYSIEEAVSLDKINSDNWQNFLQSLKLPKNKQQ